MGSEEDIKEKEKSKMSLTMFCNHLKNIKSKTLIKPMVEIKQKCSVNPKAKRLKIIIIINGTKRKQLATELVILLNLNDLFMSEYYGKLYSKRLDNLDEIEKNPRRTQTMETDTRRNRKSDQMYITSKKTKLVIF